MLNEITIVIVQLYFNTKCNHLLFLTSGSLEKPPYTKITPNNLCW